MEKTNVFIIGAGSAGKKLIKELKNSKKFKYTIKGIFDANPKKFGESIDGHIILGDHKFIANFLNNIPVDEIIIASTELSYKEIERIYKDAKPYNVKVKHLPEIDEFDFNKKLLNQTRDLNIPLSVPNLSKNILPMLEECIESGWVSTGGRFITEFEKKVVNYVGTEDAVGVQSGSAGLHVGCRLLDVKFGDEVICPTVTFIATINPIMYIGANPIFIDCDETLNMDLSKLEEFLENNCKMTELGLKNIHTNRIIKALVIVHVFGNPINMEKVIELSEKYKLKVIEDSAESLGSFYTEGKYKGKHTGTIGDIGIFSFNANKILTTGGGGMIIAKDKSILEKARFLSVQAKSDPLYFKHDEIGYNYRLTNIAAAFGVSQMDQLEDFIKIKQENYNLYKKEIENIDGLRLLPFNEETRSNYWFYSVIVDKNKYGIDRDELLIKLNECGIQSRPLWGLMSDQKPLKKFETYKIEKARYYVNNLINIPCSSNLTKIEVMQVVEKLKKFRKQG